MTIDLYRRDLALSLREAVSGTEVASTVILGQGPEPPMFVYNSGGPDVYGGVDEKAMEEWLSSYVE